MPKSIADSNVFQAANMSRLTSSDSLPAKRNQWRLELERAYQVRHTESQNNSGIDAYRARGPSPAGAFKAQEAQWVIGSEAVERGDNVKPTSVSEFNAGLRNTAVAVANLSNAALIGQGPAAHDRAMNVATLEKSISRPQEMDRSRPVGWVIGEHKGAEVQPMRIVWRDGAAYVYVLDGVIEESQMDSAVRRLRHYFEKSGVRVSGIMVGGLEKWVDKNASLDSKLQVLESDTQVLNRIY